MGDVQLDRRNGRATQVEARSFIHQMHLSRGPPSVQLVPKLVSMQRMQGEKCELAIRLPIEPDTYTNRPMRHVKKVRRR